MLKRLIFNKSTKNELIEGHGFLVIKKSILNRIFF